jgi:hypothetical protein
MQPDKSFDALRKLYENDDRVRVPPNKVTVELYIAIQ